MYSYQSSIKFFTPILIFYAQLFLPLTSFNLVIWVIWLLCVHESKNMLQYVYEAQLSNPHHHLSMKLQQDKQTNIHILQSIKSRSSLKNILCVVHTLASLFINIHLCKMYIDRSYCCRAKPIFTCGKYSVCLQNGGEPEKNSVIIGNSNKNSIYQACNYPYITQERIRTCLW